MSDESTKVREDEDKAAQAAEQGASGGAEGDPQERVAELEQALEEARQKAEDAEQERLRAVAELENVRKRARRDVENAHKYGVEKFAGELLSVKDSLEMGIDAARGENPSVEQLIEGKETTLRQLEKVLEHFGIGELDPAGEPFNPEFHEAMTTQPSDQAEPDTVLQVIQKGYLLKGRLLRPARVIVAKPAEGDEGNDSGGGA